MFCIFVFLFMLILLLEKVRFFIGFLRLGLLYSSDLNVMDDFLFF